MQRVKEWKQRIRARGFAGGSDRHGEADSGVRITALFLAAHWHNGRAVFEIRGALDRSRNRDGRCSGVIT